MFSSWCDSAPMSDLMDDPVCDMLSSWFEPAPIPATTGLDDNTVAKSLNGCKLPEPIGIHPAELSGPSQKPELRLMGLPFELRNQIFRYVLVDELALHQELKSPIPSTTPVPSRIHGLNCVSCMVVPSNSTNSAAVLQTCKAAYEEGRKILFGNDQWFNTHMELFKGLLRQFQKPGVCALLAPFNAITMRLDRHTEFMPAMQLIRRKMPTLQHLQITIVLERECSGEDANVRRMRRYGNQNGWLLMSAAVEFTRNHPTLKKAVWHMRTQWLEDPGVPTQYRGVPTQCRRDEAVQIVLDLVPASLSLESCQPVYWPIPTRMRAFGVYKAGPSTHTVLEDSWVGGSICLGA